MDWKQGITVADSSFPDDEIGSLGKTFSTMVKENEGLTVKLYQSKLKEREAELKAFAKERYWSDKVTNQAINYCKTISRGFNFN